MGHLESEVKLRVAGPDEGRELVASVDAVLVRPRHFEANVLLEHPAIPLASRGRILRIRRFPGGGLLTYKAPLPTVEGVKNREEIETTVADPEALEGVLLRLGFRPVFRYQKYREVYQASGLEIVLDETPVGTFLEIEGETEQIHVVAAALGFGRDDYIADSYVALFRAAGGQGDMVFS